MRKKNWKKVLLGIGTGMMLIFATAATALAGSKDGLTLENSVKEYMGTPSNLVQTKATTNSIGISWDSVSGAEAYQIAYKVYVSGDTSDDNYTFGYTAGTSFNIKGLKANTKYKVAVRAGSSAEVGEYFRVIYCKTLPGKPAFAGQRCDYNNQKYNLYFKDSSNAAVEGYQVKYTNLKTKSAKTVTTGTYSATLPLKNGTFYKVTVRGYITVNGKKAYGTARTLYLAQQPKLSRKSYNSSSMTVKWPKVKGATNYTVYASTKANSGYKKVKTTTGTTYTHRNMKINKTYYIYVKANRKVSGKTYSSPASYYSQIKIYRY